MCHDVDAFQYEENPREHCLSYCKEQFPDNTIWPSSSTSNDDIAYCGHLDQSEKQLFEFALCILFSVVSILIVGGFVAVVYTVITTNGDDGKCLVTNG